MRAFRGNECTGKRGGGRKLKYNQACPRYTYTKKEREVLQPWGVSRIDHQLLLLLSVVVVAAVDLVTL